MKHLKTYESESTEPQIGDFVICEEDTSYDASKQVNDLINNVIGEIVNISPLSDNPYKVYFYFDKPINNHLFVKNCRHFKLIEIKSFSPDKEFIEAQLSANKYNI